MHRGQRAMVALATLVVVPGMAGCGHGGSHSNAGPPSSGPAGPARIEVVLHQVVHRAGPHYTEGAVPEVRLVDAAGHLVGTRRSQQGSVTFTGLQPGRYVVEPAVRPCEGTCVELDPRTDGCRRAVAVTDVLRAKVEFVVGQPCRISL